MSRCPIKLVVPKPIVKKRSRSAVEPVHVELPESIYLHTDDPSMRTQKITEPIIVDKAAKRKYYEPVQRPIYIPYTTKYRAALVHGLRDHGMIEAISQDRENNIRYKTKLPKERSAVYVPNKKSLRKP